MAETMMTLEQYDTIRKEMEPRRELERGLRKIGMEMRDLSCWCEDRIEVAEFGWREDCGHYLVGECENGHPFRVLVD